MQTLKKAASAVAGAMPGKETVKNASATVAETVGKAVLGKGTVEDMQKGQGDDKKRGMKGLGKAGIVLAVMITVGVLATGPFGPLIAAVLAIGAGIATPKIASALGSKGMEFSEEERQNNRLDQLKPAKLQERKKELEESASQKKKIGIAAISIGVLVAFLTGGTAIPLLLGALAIGCGSIYSSMQDSKKAKALEGINERSRPEEMQNAAQAAGIIKQKDVSVFNAREKEKKSAKSQNATSEVGTAAVKTMQNIRNTPVDAKTLNQSPGNVNQGKTFSPPM